MSVGQKIREYRKARGMTQQQIADLFGIKTASVSEWESGKSTPSTDKLVRLAKALGCQISDLLERTSGATVDLADPDGDAVSIRQARLKLSAGVSGYAIEYEDGDGQPIFFRKDWMDRNGYRAEKLLAVKVSGVSMEPGLYDGDVVVVNLADSQPHDGAAFAVNYEGELVIKRLLRDDGEWWLTSDNPDKRRFANKRCSDGVQLLGRVIHKQSSVI